MRTCSKEFNLHVEPDLPCVDWTQLSWPDPANPTWPFLSTVPPGSSSLNPNVPMLTHAFDWSVSNGDGFGAGGAASGGVLTYNGPACNCNLAYTITNVGDVATGMTANSITVVVAGVGTLVSILVKTLGAGVHVANVPFVVADTLGVPKTIRVAFSMQVSAAAFPHPITSSAGSCILTTV